MHVSAAHAIVDIIVAAIAKTLGNCTVVSADDDLTAVPELFRHKFTKSSTTLSLFKGELQAVFFFLADFFGSERLAFDGAGRVSSMSSADSTSRLPTAAA